MKTKLEAALHLAAAAVSAAAPFALGPELDGGLLAAVSVGFAAKALF